MEPSKPKIWTAEMIPYEGWYLSNDIDMTKPEDNSKFVDKDAYDVLKAERDELEAMICKVNEHIFPGEVDTVDSLRMILKERDELKDELDRTNKVYLMNRDWIEYAKSKITALKGECEQYRKTIKLQAGEVERLKDFEWMYKDLCK